MNSIELLEALRAIAPGCRTRGVFARDRIPIYWSTPSALILNTDRHSEAGTHWIAIVVDKNRHGTYFDSYGVQPMFPEYMNRLRVNTRTCEWNKLKLQCNTSRYCGHYCLVLIYFLTRGYTLKKFCKMFSSDCKKNDQLVYNFYKRHIKDKIRKHRHSTIDKVHRGRSAIRLRYVQNCKPAFMYT